MNRKKKHSIADKINEALKPRDLTEENDEIEAKFEEFDENIDGFNEVSNIRKQQAKELSELDSKYKGKAVSRKELELDEDELSSENDQLEVDDSEEELSSDSELGESSAESENSQSDDDDNDDFGDIDLAQFSKASTSKGSENGIQKEAVLVNEANEDIQKGVCVQNQLKIWEKLLEVRIKAQKMLISANSLPNYDDFIDLSEIDHESQFLEKCENACDNIYSLIDNLLELQSTLVEKFTESSDVLKGVKRKGDTNEGGFIKRSRLAEYSDMIEENYEVYKQFGSQVLQKWHDRTKNLKDSRNPAMNMSILDKIQSALLGKKEMIRKTQLYRGDYDIFGVEKPQNAELELVEVFDDTDFYHQLLRELIEHKSNVGDNQSEITQKFIELQKVRNKMKRKVETRASKGRKIRYNVHNKLVNFMPSKDSGNWTEEAKSELFSSLFGSIK